MTPDPACHVPRTGLLGRVGRAVPAAVVLAALAGAAYWGHHTGWTLHPGGPPGRAVPDRGLAEVRVGPPEPGRADLPPALRRPVAIVFDSADAVEKAGIDVAPAWQERATESVTAGGQVGFDPARVVRVPARAPGSARRVFKTVGDPVRAGEILALLDSAEVGKAKAEFLQALVQARLRRRALDGLTLAGATVPPRQRAEAEAALKDADTRVLAAEQALVNLGLPVRAADFADVPPDEAGRRLRLAGVPAATPGTDPAVATANLLPVVAPLDGVVLTADVTAGEVAEAGRVLFVVVDPSRVWVTLHVGAGDAQRVGVSRPARFRPDGTADEAAGRVAWVGTAADEVTRTVPVRLELANEAGTLRAGTLGRGRVVVREAADAVLVPAQAVRAVGGTPVVFVRDPDFLMSGGPKAFHARPVRTAATDGGEVEVVAGLKPGEVVATRGSDLLLGELTKSAAGGGR